MTKLTKDKTVLLAIGDGPEGIEIYTSDQEGVIDWAATLPALYVSVTINGAMAHFGPFVLSKSLIAQLNMQLVNGSCDSREDQIMKYTGITDLLLELAEKLKKITKEKND